MTKPVNSDLVEVTDSGYVVKTSKAETGQKIPCPNNEMTFERLNDHVKITLKPGMKVSPISTSQ